ncbi:MAG: ribbon-helix-helix domain-containing protein [Cyanobacteria bacterium P01_A01_bin.37]
MAKKKSSLADIALTKGATTTPVHPPTGGDSTGDDEKRIGQTLRLLKGAHKQLKQLALDLDKPMHDVLIEAVNDLFIKYGKPPIA